MGRDDYCSGYAALLEFVFGPRVNEKQRRLGVCELLELLRAQGPDRTRRGNIDRGARRDKEGCYQHGKDVYASTMLHAINVANAARIVTDSASAELTCGSEIKT